MLDPSFIVIPEQHIIDLILFAELDFMIKYIECPSEELQLIVIGLDYKNYQYIKNPSEKVKMKYIEMKLSS